MIKKIVPVYNTKKKFTNQKVMKFMTKQILTYMFIIMQKFTFKVLVIMSSSKLLNIFVLK